MIIILRSNSHVNKQNHKYSYVMKRGVNILTPKQKNNNKNKHKVKSSTKEKKFNPLEYLNSLIEDIHDNRFDTVRKRVNSTSRQERSSALAYATPITERTASSSKVRSRSSYSQYRKKSIPLRNAFRIDLKNVITEEDNNIHFTEETIYSDLSVSQHPGQSMLLVLTPSIAARKIQRAWRKYQTLKVVRKYYIYYKNLLQQETEIREKELAKGRRSEHEKKKQFQRTLKIRKGSEKGSQIKTVKRTSNELSQDLLQISGNTTKQLIRIRQQGEQMIEGDTQQLPVLLKEYHNHSRDYTSKDLNFVMEMFRSNQQNASKQIENQFNTYSKVHAQLTPMSYFTSIEQDSASLRHINSDSCDEQITDELSPGIFIEMERAIKKKYYLLKEKAGQQLSDKILSEADFHKREEQLEGRMRRELRAIEKCREDYNKSNRQLKQNMIKLETDFFIVERLEKSKGDYVRKIRKCYSAQNIILKSILEDVTMNNFDIEIKTRFKPQIFLQSLKGQCRQQRHQESIYPMCPTSPPSGLIQSFQNCHTGCSKSSLSCFQVNSGDKLREQLYNNLQNLSFNQNQKESEESIPQSQNELVEIQSHKSNSSLHISVQQNSVHDSQYEDPNIAMLKQCCQELQEKIQKILIAEIVEDIYVNSQMFGAFKPYIEHPFEFKQISDFDIQHFLKQQLPRFCPSIEKILVKFNQKINPNSLQILRLIRDFDFEIEEYELVLPQQIFKTYRKFVEQQYANRIKVQSAPKPIPVSVLPLNIAKLVSDRCIQKQTKKAKFLSFQRDLKIMYMKSVFNCYNQLIIETKSFYTFMNGRSSIGPGQLTLALKEYNWECGEKQCEKVLGEAHERVSKIIQDKCMLPIFKNYKQLEHFQKQITKQITTQLTENEFKWVNYMDEILQIWQELSLSLTDILIEQALGEIARI